MLSARFDDALVYAIGLHRDEVYTPGQSPFAAHLLSICALTLEYGGDENCAIAALLHAAAATDDTFTDIEQRFGPRVLDIVANCDLRPVPSDEGDWHASARGHLAKLRTTSDDAVLVMTCCALHETTRILELLISDGFAVFDTLPEGRRGALWYYRELAEALENRSPGPLTARMKKVVAQIEYWVNSID